MNFPPTLLHLRIPTSDGFIGMWLPWFLVYVLVLALMLVALPFALIMALFLIPGGRWRPLVLGGPYIWRILFSMRGLKVDIQQPNNRKMMLDFV